MDSFAGDSAFPINPSDPLDRTDELIQQASAVTRAIANVFKRIEAAPGDHNLELEFERLQGELARLQDEIKEEDRRAVAFLKSEYGVDEDWLQRFQATFRPAFGNDYRTADIQRVPSTVRLEDVVAHGYERLIQIVDPAWLREQARGKYRLQYDASASSDCRLHLVGRQRLMPPNGPTRPQRFAQMLLVCDDLLMGRHDIDMFDGPLLVSEAAALGGSLNEIAKLGPEAECKLKSLSSATDRDVASTIHELLVGAACVRSGRDTEMLQALKNQKTPDFRIHDLPVPMVIECKRRLGLNDYAVREARGVERLYAAVDDLFHRCHPIVEAEFSVEISEISEQTFRATLEPMCESWDDVVERQAPWGAVRMRRLPLIRECSPTRVFSPVFLREVFEWDHVESEWDGLLCEVRPTFAPVASAVELPRCLKWRCNNEVSRLKKARGLTSLWADAVRQIPTGETGCVYIAYVEGMRPAIADDRTQHLLDTVAKRDLYHRANVQVPLTVVSRLYPQALGNGGLEMIESTIPMTLDGYDHMIEDFPTRVFHMRLPT